jgi:hypothetical protein
MTAVRARALRGKPNRVLGANESLNQLGLFGRILRA